MTRREPLPVYLDWVRAHSRGAMFVAAREMRFLQTLRGPAGQGLHLTRLGSFDGPDDTILDVYQVEHGNTVHHLYVDAYRSAELKAPVGLVCGPSAPAQRRDELNR